MTTVNSIVIPDRFVAICERWHDGTGCMLYAVASTRGLTTGRAGTIVCDVSDVSDEQRYLMIWRDLSADLYFAIKMAGKDHWDSAILHEFDDWIDSIIDRLEKEYNLADWGV